MNQTSDFKIDKGVPIPEKKWGKSLLVLFEKLEVGDSFLVSSDKKQNYYQAMSKYKSRHSGWNFTSRNMGNKQIRFWRIS